MDVFASVDGRDLGGWRTTLQVMKPFESHLPRGTQMRSPAGRNHAVLIFRTAHRPGDVDRAGLLLIVVSFQSWLDPFIIITALPGALAGILWILSDAHCTERSGTHGAVMCIESLRRIAFS